MAAPKGFLVNVDYKSMSYSYYSNKTDAREVVRELVNKKDILFDWLSCKITLKRVEKYRSSLATGERASAQGVGK